MPEPSDQRPIDLRPVDLRPVEDALAERYATRITAQEGSVRGYQVLLAFLLGFVLMCAPIGLEWLVRGVWGWFGG